MFDFKQDRADLKALMEQEAQEMNNVDVAPVADEQVTQPVVIDKSGRPSDDEIKMAMQSGNPLSLIAQYRPPSNKERTQRYERMAGIEALSNAFNAIGGIASVSKGGPVGKVDRVRIDSNIAKAEQSDELDKEAQRKNDLMYLQEAINQIRLERSEREKRNALTSQQEHDLKKMETAYQRDMDKIKAQGEQAKELQVMRSDADIKQERIRANTQMSVQNKRLEETKQKRQAALDKENPRLITLMDRDGNDVGMLRKREFETLFREMASSDSVLNDIMKLPNTDPLKRSFLRSGGQYTEDIKAMVVHRYWQAFRPQVERLMEVQDLELNEFSTRDTDVDDKDPLGLFK